MRRHRHQEFLRFLNAVEAAVPAGKLEHTIPWRGGQTVIEEPIPLTQLRPVPNDALDLACGCKNHECPHLK